MFRPTYSRGPDRTYTRLTCLHGAHAAPFVSSQAHLSFLITTPGARPRSYTIGDSAHTVSDTHYSCSTTSPVDAWAARNLAAVRGVHAPDQLHGRPLSDEYAGSLYGGLPSPPPTSPATQGLLLFPGYRSTDGVTFVIAEMQSDRLRDFVRRRKTNRPKARFSSLPGTTSTDGATFVFAAIQIDRRCDLCHCRGTHRPTV